MELPNTVAEMYSTVLPAVLCVILSAVFYFKLLHRKILPLPPGPRRWPILGNALDMPREKEWLTYTEWGKTYGDIVYLSIFGRSIIVLNSAKAAFDLLDKRSYIYSDRPYLAMGGELVGWDHSVAVTPYGARFRRMRQLMHQVLSPRPAQAFWPVEEKVAARFLNHLLESPERFIDHIRHMAGAVTLSISHGYNASEFDDPLVHLAEKTVDEFSASTTCGAFLVDFLPWLKYVPSWFPGASFRRKAAEWRKDLFQMADVAHQFTKDQMAKGSALPSFTSKHLEGTYSSETEALVKWTAHSIYGGGADSTVSATATFILAMCLHPEVQVAAQAELDAVVGNRRLPCMADRPSLPYIVAVMKEVLRWSPVGPAGVPHRVTREDEYEGYRIPVGTSVIANIWGMMHNPVLFPDPHAFQPSRFMGSTLGENTATDPLQIVFGFGRRVCPGQYLAEPSLFLSIAMTLATFTISKARDQQSGKILEPTVEWLPGTISHPKPFRCEIKPRSAQAVEAIKDAIGGDRSTIWMSVVVAELLIELDHS